MIHVITPLTAYLRMTNAQPPRPADLPAGGRVMRIRAGGTIRLQDVTHMIDSRLAGQEVLVVDHGTTILVADLAGEVLIEHTRPSPGTTYVGNGRLRGPRTGTPKPPPKS